MGFDLATQSIPVPLFTRMVEIHASHPLDPSVPPMDRLAKDKRRCGVGMKCILRLNRDAGLTKRNQSMRCSCKGQFLGVTSS